MKNTVLGMTGTTAPMKPNATQSHPKLNHSGRSTFGNLPRMRPRDSRLKTGQSVPESGCRRIALLSHRLLGSSCLARGELSATDPSLLRTIRTGAFDTLILPLTARGVAAYF